jgi:hypothetical protein
MYIQVFLFDLMCGMHSVSISKIFVHLYGESFWPLVQFGKYNFEAVDDKSSG